MITFENVTKTYGEKRAVDNLSMTIEDGKIFSFLGPNGAGKTTSIKLMTGIVAPDSGSIKLDGVDIAKDPKAMAIIQPMLDAQQPDFGCETESETAKEAITPEMAMAMMQNSPLRSSINFGGGAAMRTELLKLLEMLNRE